MEPWAREIIMSDGLGVAAAAVAVETPRVRADFQGKTVRARPLLRLHRPLFAAKWRSTGEEQKRFSEYEEEVAVTRVPSENRKSLVCNDGALLAARNTVCTAFSAYAVHLVSAKTSQQASAKSASVSHAVSQPVSGRSCSLQAAACTMTDMSSSSPPPFRYFRGGGGGGRKYFPSRGTQCSFCCFVRVELLL
jgi:hypothetical protein